jgi:CRP-like cAMP-binding protein
MHSADAPARGNGVLAALSDAEFLALAPKLEHIRLPLKKPLHQPGDVLRHVYFPTSGIVSLLRANRSGASAELTIIGREGMVGLPALLGSETASSHAVVQAAGSAWRLRVADAKAAFAEGTGFQALALRYADLLIQEISQTAVCNLHHYVEQQLCRWLLLCLDRLQGDEIQMTHELIASMLGVRRQGITEAAKKLQERSIIAYSRGRITVLDRNALQEAACDCYRMMQ